ncbi:hypothetical protein M413DRAFT_65292 [Hebeloma cylindrosporum]|uniref:CCD97-like C-terminal domain-containing protein n=1 Tax=Hebeloma cylindrosporum TaxID=76867 RepID=A0A0C3CR60_HEBCY|nr:hypothetical protein M413DRAFT_65292 [Hebeloma cylindrosporum h7]
MTSPAFDKLLSLKYLCLPEDYTPSPDTDPIAFLDQFLFQLPPHLLLHFSYITTPKQRTVLAPIRNRRLHYTNKNPSELRFESGRNTWPELWQGRERRGVQEGNEERVWAQHDFLLGNRQHVGKLANLLANYEEEREAERVRTIRRNRAPVEDDFVPEEDSDSDDDVPPDNETEQETQESFERLIRERFIYGLLDNIDYDKADWDESLGVQNDREAEERWFESDEE